MSANDTSLLYIAFIYQTKVFDLVSRDGLFKILNRIGCLPTLLRILISFHENQHCAIIADGDRSKPFKVSGVKQGCVLAPTLFGIFFSCVLVFAFQDSSEGIYLHTSSDGKLRLCAKTKVRKVLICELLFAADAALVAHKDHELQQVLCQGADTRIYIDNTVLEVVDRFTYLRSTMSNKIFLNAEINIRIAKANSVMA